MTILYRNVGVAENGRRVGQHHPKAVLTDAEVDLIRHLYGLRDQSGKRIWTFRKLAKKFEVSAMCIHHIVLCRRRAQAPSSYKRVPINP